MVQMLKELAHAHHQTTWQSCAATSSRPHPALTPLCIQYLILKNAAWMQTGQNK